MLFLKSGSHKRERGEMSTIKNRCHPGKTERAMGAVIPKPVTPPLCREDCSVEVIFEPGAIL